MMGISAGTFLYAAKLSAAKKGTTVKSVLESILVGQFETSVSNGKTLVRTSEAGGSVEFAIAEGLDAGEVAELAREALDWHSVNPDSNPRRIRRLRATFNRASL
jgi:hypothetical protein